MSISTVKYISKLLVSKGITAINEDLLKEFIIDKGIEEKVVSIIKLQEEIMDKWIIKSRVIDFNNESIFIPNGTVNTTYKYSFNPLFFSSKHITDFCFSNLEEIGLSFNKEENSIEGTPNESGDFKIIISFKVEGETESGINNTKEITLVVNPDPKSLWKDIASDQDAMFWKVDDRSVSGATAEKKVVISSKRGRSHQNVGSFRDDDFAFKYFEDSEWSIVAVSDGAGSATFSRKGSELACNEVLASFENTILENNELKEFEDKINTFKDSKDEFLLEEAKKDGKKVMYKVVVHVHQKLKELADTTFQENPEVFNSVKAKDPIEYFHSTLIFTAFKKLEIGYVFLTFGVGDCPIGIVNKEQTNATLLNWLDVGEFGGGTRFITQRDIFHSKERPMASRFNIHIQKDFSYLFLMTDGIYDPKFEVEANLEKNEKWMEFIKDLKGNNEDNRGINFEETPEEVEKNLNTWMDFWSKGNHDDRTLAIIY
ncbi:PP2C family serine/threonine-protein phosphatase [Tenacibaculum finnmarkense]|uniref:PP2C family serine/threonine-protein phosphatase n=1 Tax=Tenacibaculum finnmarkense TaxID=2781243 RepID=UPI001FB1798B|nr:PP2C family serine/threonine-protein phosphatase [Tenacibaculum finnmarkense]